LGVRPAWTLRRHVVPFRSSAATLAAARGRIVVHVADPAALVHHLDPHDVATIELDAFGAQHAAATLGLGTTDRVGRIVAGTATVIVETTTWCLTVSTMRPGLRPSGTSGAARDRSG